MLHHVGMIWIIENHEDLKYDTELQNSDWMTVGPWYNTSICNKLHGGGFEGFFINARTDIIPISSCIYNKSLKYFSM